LIFPAVTIREVFQPTILLALALMAVIAMMVLPVPAWMLDIGLALSFALAILMLTVALFIERPLDFSAFPTILLASLLLRLSLNISSTKLIIGQGHSGTDAAGHAAQQMPTGREQLVFENRIHGSLSRLKKVTVTFFMDT
jgi:flagellar biosynthesis protein FlhA